MNINFSKPSFKGVVLAGSAPQQKENTINQVQENIKLANTIADSFKEKGEDTYIVGISPLDSTGKMTKRIHTYVLYGEEAKVANKFGEIKSQLSNLFRGQGNSDLFEIHLDKRLMDISQEQSKTAQFIAENKFNWRKSNFSESQDLFTHLDD